MKTKKFDSVKMMREIRESLSKDFSKLSVKEKISLLEKEFPQIKKREQQKHPITTGWIAKLFLYGYKLQKMQCEI